MEYARERMFTTITDQGPGIPDDDRERIFEKFTRLDGHGRPAPGVGLGLYIVRRSVEAMGGTVWVDDGPAGGSAFSFTLPAVPVKAKRAPSGLGDRDAVDRHGRIRAESPAGRRRQDLLKDIEPLRRSPELHVHAGFVEVA